jgi:hypothetical protein
MRGAAHRRVGCSIFRGSLTGRERHMRNGWRCLQILVILGSRHDAGSVQAPEAVQVPAQLGGPTVPLVAAR